MQRIQDCMRSGKVKVLFNSTPLEFRRDSVLLDVDGSVQELSNDYVWIFAGGTPPTEFLSRIGVRVGMRDMTLEAGNEAKQASAFRQQTVGV